MKYIFPLLLSIIFYSCSASDQNNTEQQNVTGINPCKDSLYLVYRAEPPDALSDTQKMYLKEKEKECTDYKAKQEENKDNIKHPNENLPYMLGAAFVVVLLLTFVILSSK